MISICSLSDSESRREERRGGRETSQGVGTHVREVRRPPGTSEMIRLDRPGTVFVAVGAGHLVGSDSLQVQLSTLGIKSARIN